MCKILFKSMQVSACYCKMFRGSLFRGHSVVVSFRLLFSTRMRIISVSYLVVALPNTLCSFWKTYYTIVAMWSGGRGTDGSYLCSDNRLCN